MTSTNLILLDMLILLISTLIVINCLSTWYYNDKAIRERIEQSKFYHKFDVIRYMTYNKERPLMPTNRDDKVDQYKHIRRSVVAWKLKKGVSS